ncbi:hypothetical protein M5K25_019220 [Dendrobium thyrsiflorum]|uniref:Protein FAR1-RELATED SEQUENCE n=1 Tax=Dendrobium thyrsiflorum TaxID=117978 RepID=A0ABD0UL97_DENTH
MFRISEPSEVPSSNQEKVEEDVEMEVKDEEALARAEEGLVGQPPDEQALRVAQIVRTYLHMKKTAEGGEGGGGDAESPAGDRCKAMMEVVLKENGKWSISKLETEHNHSLNAASPGDGSTKVALTIGMVFDSVEEAKAFYYGYGDKIGFRARTGSNRRSVGKGALIMQRFLCWRGSYPLQRRNLETSTGKRKRGPYKKRSKLLDELEEKKDGDGDVVEVVDVDSSAEKIGVADDDFGVYVESRPSVKGSIGGDCAAEIENRALVKSTASSETTKTPASEMKNGGQPPATSVSAQSKLLRELGVRVYRYSSDEKRDIILRYLMKKNNRQSGERTIKFFTTQPPPGENFLQQQNIQQQQNIPQQHEAGGKFIGWVPLQFLKKYEEFVKEQRYMEQEADYLTSQCVSRAPTLRFLWQAANVYTLAAFEMFKMEFELLSNCLVYGCGDVGSVSEYEGTVSEYEVEQILQTKLLEKTSMNNFSKGQSQSQIQGEGIDNENNGESRRSSGKKKNDATVRRRQQNGMDMSKQYKGLKGKSDAVEVSMDASDPLMASNEIPSQARNSSNQIFPPSQSFQGPYIPGHQFGLGSFHGFHGTPQFTQEFSAPVLQQQSFPGEAHLSQASEIHALQFVASNSQLGPQGGDQGHYTIPVWDFL